LDSVYFSLAVATTIGATDINITTPLMRRVVNLHTVLTFLYNSVIVAVLASLLLSWQGWAGSMPRLPKPSPLRSATPRANADFRGIVTQRPGPRRETVIQLPGPPRPA
jgi:Protein of unknown function (DUF1345)